jgi:hypothetical protein
VKGVLDEHPIDSLLTDEWDHVRDLIGGHLRDCEDERTFDPSDLPFILYFETQTKRKLIKAGFDKDDIDDQELFELVLTGLDHQGSPTLSTWNRPYGYPADVVTFSEDRRTYWIRPDIDAALRALQSIAALKELLRNNDAVRIYLQSFEMVINLLRSGNAPELAHAEAEKRDKSKWTREIKKRIMRRTIERVFEKFPNMPKKSLGAVWNKFDLVNKDKPFIVVNKDTGRKEEFTVRTGKGARNEDIVIIAGRETGQLEYAKRSLQHFIDELKKPSVHITQ